MDLLSEITSWMGGRRNAALALKVATRTLTASSSQWRQCLGQVGEGVRSGTVAGAAVGAIIGVMVAVADVMLFAKPAPVGYVFRGQPTPLRPSQEATEAGVEAAVRAMQTYRDAHPGAYDRAAFLTQRMIDARARFRTRRDAGGDGVREIALMARTAVRADALWRELVRGVRASGDWTGVDAVTSAAVALHVWGEACISESREEFTMSEQLAVPPPAAVPGLLLSQQPSTVRPAELPKRRRNR
ncbi:hypothetical protein JKP88DRAFT_273047 [Tribonema minus]|uniref:Uncharacterized protein n=1 Tax=Tribonema minus TaxID=303371 RepID=A0A835YX78_9STRA|nr:hypothetical protein JKP88DRAFT_273047 [Tribonema minus]